MAHLGDRPYLIEFLGRGRGRVTDADVKRIVEQSPKFHVLVNGSKEESRALLGAAGPKFTLALSKAAQMALNHGELSGGDIDKASRLVAASSHAKRKDILKGAGFWDFLKKVGHFALKALPVVAQVAPIIAAAL